MLRCVEITERVRGGQIQFCPVCYWLGSYGQQAVRSKSRAPGKVGLPMIHASVVPITPADEHGLR